MEILPGITLNNIKDYHKTFRGYVWLELYDGRGKEVEITYSDFVLLLREKIAQSYPLPTLAELKQ